MVDDDLTIKDVATLLKFAGKNVYAMARVGGVPASEIRGQWRIERTEIDRVIDAKPRGGEGGGCGE